SIAERVYGPNLMLQACEMAETSGFSVFLYGGRAQTLDKLKTNLLKRFPSLSIAGAYSPPFRSLTPDEEIRIITMINKASPDILFVGLGAPKQEKWMARHCDRLNVPVTLGVGAAFDFLSGEKRQASIWMQRRGLEWLYRLLNEPTRLWKRYLLYNPLFVTLFLGQLIGARFNVSARKTEHER
nr:WecB/TagA/CpsF family glycosyltransferase [Nitrososphaeria archaeon]NIQ32261.1 WecB/TagA/CpsF family glycosyltransferase [Nitrososphaeria archaeon]